ncbi:VWA domain-containing protein [Nonomuraea lactucae]|uniref:VWA domain-containing protein n=1 Tax=Nonomuraea lactucae TaxID=2249762 RepID=UPI000DE31B7C|nr:VWA domain-containing protein [Nonomuraea lactucae]
MQRVTEDTEGGLKAFLTEQANTPAETFVSLCQFDDHYETVYEFTALADVPDFQLRPRGLTALLDAIGKTITTMRAQFDAVPDSDLPGEVVVVILTEGKENASRQWRSRTQIRRLIAAQQDEAWKFIFLGADQEAFAAAGDMGIGPDTTLSYSSSSGRWRLRRRGPQRHPPLTPLHDPALQQGRPIRNIAPRLRRLPPPAFGA